ncbi:MAG: hypothetical protein QXY90_03325 [Candidatus Anstonellales archaeon]
MNRDEILKRGFVLYRVQRSGMFQKLRFRVEYEEVGGGKIPYLCTDKIVDAPELLRLCNEANLPVKAKNGKFFPEGKSSIDFLIPSSDS